MLSRFGWCRSPLVRNTHDKGHPTSISMHGSPLPDNTPHEQNCSIRAVGKIHQSEIQVLPDRKIFPRILLASTGGFSRFRKQTAWGPALSAVRHVTPAHARNQLTSKFSRSILRVGEQSRGNHGC